MKDIKITVVASLLMEDLIAEYGAPGIGLCTRHKVGDSYIAPGDKAPEGFCEEAWKSIGHFAFAMAHGVEVFWPQWISKPHLAIASCNDGLRPVVFKLETIE